MIIYETSYYVSKMCFCAIWPLKSIDSYPHEYVIK
jgi:hypothetical protein